MLSSEAECSTDVEGWALKREGKMPRRGGCRVPERMVVLGGEPTGAPGGPLREGL